MHIDPFPDHICPVFVPGMEEVPTYCFGNEKWLSPVSGT